MPSKTTMTALINELKESPIQGCITGSCLLDDDMSSWTDEPDIDIFVYSAAKMVDAVRWLVEHGWEYGNAKNSQKNPAAEQWKHERLLNGDNSNRKFGITTIYVQKQGISANVSMKYGRDGDNRSYCLHTASQVIESFDMNLTMIAWDIKSGKLFDLRETCGMSKKVATPNPYKDWDVTPWSVEKWLRQWNRVVKYWQRGFDTRPMAKFYIDSIDIAIAMPNLFPAEDDEEESLFQQKQRELDDHKKIMVRWLRDKEDC